MPQPQQQPSPSSPQRPPGLRDNTRSSSLEDDLSHLAGPGHGSGTAFLSSLRHNPSLAPFYKPHFDAASFSAQVVVADSAAGAGTAGIGTGASSSASARSRAEVMVAQLTEQLGQAEAAIEKHILQHQKQLMQGMGDLGELRENCDVLTVRSKELRRSVNKLTAELLEPYQGTERRTQQLRRLHEANDILKKVSRFSTTLARLKKESNSSSSGGDSTEGGNDDPVVAVEGLELRDLAKAAQHLQEVEALFQDPTLGGISLLAAERPYVTALGKGLRRTAKDSLLAALQSMNQADLGPALQVFYNLRHLAPVVLECISTIVAEAANATRRAFDPQTLEKVASLATSTSTSPPSSSSSSSPTGASASGRTSTAELEAIALRQRRARFRDHCDKWATVLYQCAIKIWHLQRVLHKKVDATTNEGFLDVVLQSTDFQKALEHALLASPAAGGAKNSSTGLKRGHSHGSSNGNNSSSSNSGPSSPSSVGALYWMFWLELTAAIRTVAEKAAKRASPSLTTSNTTAAATAAAAAAAAAGPAPVIKCYPYFLLGLTDVLDRLVDSTSKHKLGSLPSSSGAGGGSHQQQQGNPAALRALMEALGVDEHTHSAMLIEGEEQQQQQQQQQQQVSSSSSSSSSASVLFLPDQAGGSAEERTSLIEALGSLRDLYLGDSLQRLCRPIEQMFPTQEGFQAAVPSKHDLQALFRVMQTELLTGLAEGGPLLLPHLVRGVVKAVHLFCTKVEAMTNTSEGARKLYALRGWMLGPEKEHNLQLLQLVAFLHQGLKRLPQDLAAAVGGREGGRGGEEALLMEAATALETLAVTEFVHPYMMDIAAELGGILAEMHLENYAPGRQQQQRQEQQQQQDGDGQGGGGNSRFITAFQTAVTGLRKHHLSKFPTQADFVSRAFKWLTGRLLRLYVSHAALLRPLNEAGKTKLTNDMAMLETSLSSIHPKLSELGAPYLELKAFRELCFYGDEQNPLTVNGLAKERFTAHLRPSTLLDALFARAPLELSSPHVLQRCSERTLVEELLALYYKDGGREAGEGGDPRMLAESAHWQVVQVCLDAYAQRMSASQADLAYIYDVMLNLGGLLLKGFGERLGREKKDGGSSGVAAVVLPLNW